MEGFTVWFTGLPSAGKTTIATLLAGHLRERGCRVELLDGDECRRNLSAGLGYSRQDRDANIKRIAYVCKLLARHGVVAIAAAISPYRAARERARAELGRFVEVYVKCPVQVCIARDVKGLYRRALAGEIPNFTGVSDPYEEPLSPEVVLETDKESAHESLARLVRRLAELGFLGTDGAGPAGGPEPVYSQAEEELIKRRLGALGYLD